MEYEEYIKQGLNGEAPHKFYEKAGFRKISVMELPVSYSYPDRDSLLYMLDL